MRAPASYIGQHQFEHTLHINMHVYAYSIIHTILKTCAPIVIVIHSPYRNGMLRESQLSTRNMVNGVTEEFWKMVRDSINEQALNFKSKIYMYMCN